MAAVFKHIALFPAVTGTLWYLLSRAPERIRAPLLRRLSEHVSTDTITGAITTLKWLFALGLARNLHVFLNELAQNNFRFYSERHRYNWPKEVAVVTGAGSGTGFGALMTKDLASKGVNVVAIDIREDLPPDMKSNAKIHYYCCDITDRAAVMQLADTVRSAHGDPSILINNAGVGYEGGVMDASETSLKSVFNVNIISHYYTLQAFLPAMIASKKGHVVSLASMASFVSTPGMVPYSNTKAAILGLHEGLQQEMRVYHRTPEIKFTIVHPSFAATPMTEPYVDKMRAAKVVVLDPKVVSDAVVRQIMSGRGRQIVLPGAYNFVSCVRGWPHWISQALFRTVMP